MFVQDHELDLKLNYSYCWSPSVMLRPNLQYVIHPGATNQVKNALVGGLTVKLDF
ncbi:carbohydrate porin [Acinetobacter sp.]|uniref:carbohydrate porin n=1 Tax=Acinetobacter sp. TaxID=472 RepID=UPI002582CE05|nr:carbohydrate porin [Acinetobacter sp.]